MSSHREAPRDQYKDPVADNTDLYAVRQPRRPEHGHDRRELHSARSGRRRPELLRVRRRRPLLDLHRQRRRRRAGDRVSVPVPDDPPEQQHVPLTTRDRSPRSIAHPGTGGPVLLGHSGSTPAPIERRARWATPTARGRQGPLGSARSARTRMGARPDLRDGARDEPPLPAVQRRGALHAQLRGEPGAYASGTGCARRRHHQGVLRTASRPLRITSTSDRSSISELCDRSTRIT